MTVPISPDDVVTIAVLLLLWYFDPFALTSVYRRTASGDRSNDESDRRFAAAMRQQPLPPAVFGVVWAVLYYLLAFSQFVYARELVGTDYYATAHILFFVNWLLNKFWAPTFFGARSPGAGLFIILLVLGTAIALLVVAALDAAPAVVLVTLVLYVIWLLVATGLNVYVWRLYSSARVDGGEEVSDAQATYEIGSATRAVSFKLR